MYNNTRPRSKYEDERACTKDNSVLGKLGIPPGPVSFDVDPNGTLNVAAADKTTDSTASPSPARKAGSRIQAKNGLESYTYTHRNSTRRLPPTSSRAERRVKRRPPRLKPNPKPAKNEEVGAVGEEVIDAQQSEEKKRSCTMGSDRHGGVPGGTMRAHVDGEPATVVNAGDVNPARVGTARTLKMNDIAVTIELRFEGFGNENGHTRTSRT
ncbi:hypothetical protein EXIGLDRAFT_703425 [Exidia glandulosa HHB12029]|uniref:Uncharacterized protein n=1 Tax=Exidia glandulosa HHB12029 TaxID=1314781 RepID=A0A165C2J6_EXIGL|nr:hypothetical protein EXIGLDRAFT_703425 [Exidia glandulosa HHB12029]